VDPKKNLEQIIMDHEEQEHSTFSSLIDFRITAADGLMIEDFITTLVSDPAYNIANEDIPSEEEISRMALGICSIESGTMHQEDLRNELSRATGFTEERGTRWIIDNEDGLYDYLCGAGIFAYIPQTPLMSEDESEDESEQAQEFLSAVEQTNKQAIERSQYHGAMYIATVKEKVKYYTELLGKDYMKTKFFDSIGQEDTEVGNYIQEDPDNIVFIIDKTKLFSTSRKHVDTILAHYECEKPDSMRVMYNEKLLSLQTLGCPCIGMIIYNAAKHIIADSNFQIFALKNTNVNSKTLVSHEVRYLGRNVVSEAHCQEGSQKHMYQIYSPPRWH
jgi:hypothetical protein